MNYDAYKPSTHGFEIVCTHLKRSLMSDDFLDSVHNVLIETAPCTQGNTVLLGEVDKSNSLPKWFPFKVQYVFAGSEYSVGKLWLIVDNRRLIFVVHGHPHDLSTLYAAYSRRRTARVDGLIEKDKKCEPSPTTSSPP